jgi:hypothetical protein
MQIPKICCFSINENATKNLRNAAQPPFSRMNCIVAADFPGAKVFPSGTARR